MIRASNSVITWVKMCPLTILKPKTSIVHSLNLTYLKHSETFANMDRSMLFSSKYCMAKKKEDKDEKKKKEKTKIK